MWLSWAIMEKLDNIPDAATAASFTGALAFISSAIAQQAQYVGPMLIQTLVHRVRRWPNIEST